MLSAPNLQQIAHQTQEVAKQCKDQRLGLAFQTVSVVSLAVLGVGTAVHLLRELLRHPPRLPTAGTHENPRHDLNHPGGGARRHAEAVRPEPGEDAGPHAGHHHRHGRHQARHGHGRE